MKGFIGILLCVFIMLPLFACAKGGGDSGSLNNGRTEQPALPATPAPTPAPTPSPTDTGGKKFAFDETTLKYSDEYIVFTLPGGFDVLNEADAEEAPECEYIRSISFTNPESNGSAVRYAVYAAEADAGSLADMTREEAERTLVKTYADAGLEAEVVSVEFKNISLDNACGVYYEFKIIIAGVELNQIIKCIEKGSVRIEISYTFSEAETEAFRASAESAVPSGE